MGLPGYSEYPIVDPRGLLTPFYDGWSIDSWIVTDSQESLFPSQIDSVAQTLSLNEETLAVTTASKNPFADLHIRCEVLSSSSIPTCFMRVRGQCQKRGWLVVSVRPYNPEGVSFIQQISRLKEKNGWLINKKAEVILDHPPTSYAFSNYVEGDVANQLFQKENKELVDCDVGMATAAAIYELPLEETFQIQVEIPLSKKSLATQPSWSDSLLGHCSLSIPDKKFQTLYEIALRTLILHSPGDIFPGPYTYKRFWFRDAAFIVYAMLCAQLTAHLEEILDQFHSRQTLLGYFRSQDGEWDSNGQALWTLERFCRMMNRPLKEEWRMPVENAGYWIVRKRTSTQDSEIHSGLMPAGFSAEHLGPSDYYYWDDFWSVAGLRSAAYLLKGEDRSKHVVDKFTKEAADLMQCIERSLEYVPVQTAQKGLPASPHRRMDAGAIGSLAAGYPLQLLKPRDPRLLATVTFLMQHCFLSNSFYQEISHSSINAYLTLHVAQVLLRAGDEKFLELVQSIADLATPTGQWPEAIHPWTRGGCMGDGQHVWAAAGWVIMIRNLFVREEEQEGLLILGSGLSPARLRHNERLHFGPALTLFGQISIDIICEREVIQVNWEGQWYGEPPKIEIRLPGYARRPVGETERCVVFPKGIEP